MTASVLILEPIVLLTQAILVYTLSSLCTGNTTNITGAELGASLGYASAISICAVLIPLIHSIGIYILFCLGIQLRTICITAIYKKVLRVQQSVLHKITIGHIINLVSNDVYKFDLTMVYFNYLWIAPIVAIICIITISIYIGPIGLIGVLYILLHNPIQIMLGFLFGYFRHLQSITGDNRIKLMDQIIRGMRVIKFYVWEAPFVKYISSIRRREVKYMSLAGFCQSSNFSFFNTSIFISIFIVYSVSLAVNISIQPSDLALLFLVFNVLRIYNVFLFGLAVSTSRECVIALNRIQRILELPENISHCIRKKSAVEDSCPSIRFHNFSASWKGTTEADRDQLLLKSINLSFDRAQLVAIAGPLGSGKSSLLLSLINELPGLSGEITVSGVMSYAAQEPWIFSGTVKDNILFGSPLHRERYRQVISACGLKEDIESLESADMTLIGERGVTLSRGQKARVSLARAVYQQSDTYLLDDPLSAVDMRVGRTIFEECISTFLKGKLVILVTHQIHYVEKADVVVVMREGEIVTSGRYQDVVEHDEFCREFLRGLKDKNDRKRPLSHETIETKTDLLKSGDCEEVSIRDVEIDENPQPLSVSLTTEESQQHSSSIVTYLRYFLAGGLLATVSMLVLTVLSNGCLLLSYWWMQSISDCLFQPFTNSSSLTATQSCPWYFDGQYVGGLGLAALFTFLGSVFVFLLGFNFYYLVLQASRRLHNRMLNRLVHTPMRFFDTNPSGRILNRFSKDVGFLDEQLPFIFYDFWQFSSYIIAVVIAACAAQVFLLIPIFLLLVFTLLLRFFFLKSLTQVKRLESIARSPLYSHISISLQGLTTIRALRIEERATQDYHYFQDDHSCAWYHYVAFNRWFGQRLDLSMAFVIIFASFSASIARCMFGWNDLISFSIPLLISLALSFQYMIRLSGEVEILMVSADRILKYCNLPQERSLASRPDSVSKSYFGELEYENVRFKYSSDLPYSLENLCLKVKPGEKIGIIGRTGAGKTSLFNSLFLLNELFSGSISIDQKDIASVNLYEHRKRLSIIPQDPFLFSGTLRYNLDPFEEYSSAQLWTALDKSHLKAKIESLPGQLEACVLENGVNFSTGERQLICLARALLRDNSILLIDEATANVDMHTDVLVQQAIRSHFSHCSVLTIAHRIESVIDSDRILVLERGRICEDSAPFLMLQDENSYLSRLLLQFDPSTHMHLKQLAWINYSDHALY